MQISMTFLEWQKNIGYWSQLKECLWNSAVLEMLVGSNFSWVSEYVQLSEKTAKAQYHEIWLSDVPKNYNNCSMAGKK